MALSETIAAIATAAGKAGVGIIRISGSQSIPVAEKISTRLPRQSHELTLTSFYKDNGELIDQGLLLLFQSPRSYTGEDVVEFHCHGSDIVLDILLEEILKNNDVRLARPGEFTERAYLNDKMNLVQAEAVADLINSKSRKAAQAALSSFQGVLFNDIEQIHSEIISAKALLEASLDFPDEEDIKVDPEPVRRHIKLAQHMIQELLEKANVGERLTNDRLVAIIGRPNAGKSSLLNCLSHCNVAIVSARSGTTRDPVRQQLLINGTEVMLVDTAGVRESEDSIERESIQRSLSVIDSADLVLHVIDATDQNFDLLEHLPNETVALTVFNKSDLLGEGEYLGAISVSAKTGAGITDLIEEISKKLKLVDNDEPVIIARQRHRQGLLSTEENLSQAVNGFGHLPDEVISEILRRALACLEDITGKITADDVLGEIFSGFCVGK